MNPRPQHRARQPRVRRPLAGGCPSSSRPAPRRAGPVTPGVRAVVCVNGGTSAEVPGTWSASVEWLVRRLAHRFPAPRLPRGALPDQVVAAARALRRGRAQPRSTRHGRAGRRSSPCSASRWAAPSPFGTPAAAGVELVAGVNPWLPPAARARDAARTAARDRARRLRRAAAADPRREAVDVARRRPSARGRSASTSSATIVPRGFHAVALRRRGGGMFALPGAGALRRARRRRAGALLRVGLYLALRRAALVAARLLYRVEIVGSRPARAGDRGREPRVAARPAAARPGLAPAAALPGQGRALALPAGRLADGRARRDPDPPRPPRPALGRAGRRSCSAPGESVAIFPQGTVQGGAWTRGAARLALATGSPLVPVTIIGTKRALSRGRVSFPKIRLVVGDADPGRAGEAHRRRRAGR